MPQRFLRPGITNSDAWNSVSFEAQSFYIRILTLVDDYGRYDGRIQILHSHCFALRPDVTVKHSAGFSSELKSAGLIIVYQVDGKEFIELTKWQERARGASKYPGPDDSAAVRSGSQPNPASLAIVPSHRPSPSPQPASVPSALATTDFLNEWKTWQSHRQQIRKKLTPLTESRQLEFLGKQGPENAVKILRQSIENGWTGLFPIKINGRPKSVPVVHHLRDSIPAPEEAE